MPDYINHDHLKQIQMGSKFIEHDPVLHETVLHFAKEITNGNVLSSQIHFFKR